MLKEYSHLQELNKAGSCTKGARGQDPQGVIQTDRAKTIVWIVQGMSRWQETGRKQWSQEVREQEESFWGWGGDWGSLRTL